MKIRANIVSPAAGLMLAGAVPLGGGMPPTKPIPTPPKGSTHWVAIVKIPGAGGLAIDKRGAPNTTKWGYTLDYMTHTVIKFGTGGHVLRRWKYAAGTQYHRGGAIAVGGSGNVFVADADHGSVVKFDPDGRQLARWSGFQISSGIALDRAGNIYVSEVSPSEVVAQRVAKLSPAGTVLAHFPTPWVTGSDQSLPGALVVGSGGNITVAVHCYRENCPPPHGVQEGIVTLSPSGAFVGSLTGQNPYSPAQDQPGTQPFVVVGPLALDRPGNLYAAATLRDSQDMLFEGILVYRAGTELTATFTTPGGCALGGMASDARDALYVTCNGQVFKRIA
jgi:hypothetical protein